MNHADNSIRICDVFDLHNMLETDVFYDENDKRRMATMESLLDNKAGYSRGSFSGTARVMTLPCIPLPHRSNMRKLGFCYE